MDAANQKSDRIRMIERGFESSRLSPQRMAAAYARVLPVVVSPAAGRASPMWRAVEIGDPPRADVRHVMGA